MVKSATLTSFIAEVSVKDYWETLYANGSAVTDFHNKFHGQQEVKTTEWVDNKRVVNMVVPLALPAFLRSIAGKDKVPVQETQEFTWLDDSTLEIHSTPLSLIPGGAKFNTKLEYQIVEGRDGITVTAKVFSHASGPFGLSGAIERVMLEVATVQTQHWLEFSRDRCLNAPIKWWQQAGKLSRALSRRMSMKPSIASDSVIRTSMKKIQSDLDILEALEPRVNLGDVARSILSDAELKEAYAKTMMRTLFMLESAEDSKLDLTPSQAQELREMLTQLQRTLANITRRKDELLAACLEYELESSERVRALAQELQLARVSGPAAAARLLLPEILAGPRLTAAGQPLTKAEELELEFPGWEFLIRSSPAPTAASGSGSGSGSPSTPLSESGRQRCREASSLAPGPANLDSLHHHSTSAPDLAAAVPTRPQEEASAASPAGSTTSCADDADADEDCGEAAPAECCEPRQMPRPRPGKQPEPAARRMRHSHSAPSWSAAARGPSPLSAPPPEIAEHRLRRELEACGAALVSGGLRAQQTCGDGQRSDCPQLLLLSLLGDLAEQLEAEAAGDETSETTKQVNITLKAQVVELKRQVEGEGSLPRGGTGREGAGPSRRSIILRRLFLGGIVVLVGRWGLKRTAKLHGGASNK